jgi:hypothetical protein
MARLLKKDLQMLGTICTRDESGTHFTAKYPNEWLDKMESTGMIEIHRPVHQITGYTYSEEYYSVEVTEKAIAIGESRNWGK